jgi:hypothetical protein
MSEAQKKSNVSHPRSVERLEDGNVQVTLNIAEMAAAVRAAAAIRRARPRSCKTTATTDERLIAGRRIDAETAKVWFEYGQTLDPYGEHDLPEEFRQVGRNFFAMDPVDRIPVYFGDLDDELRRSLNTKRDEVDREGWRRIAAIR